MSFPVQYEMPPADSFTDGNDRDSGRSGGKRTGYRAGKAAQTWVCEDDSYRKNNQVERAEEVELLNSQ